MALDTGFRHGLAEDRGPAGQRGPGPAPARSPPSPPRSATAPGSPRWSGCSPRGTTTPAVPSPTATGRSRPTRRRSGSTRPAPVPSTTPRVVFGRSAISSAPRPLSAGGGAAAHLRRRVHQPDAASRSGMGGSTRSTLPWPRTGRGSPRATISGKPNGTPPGGREPGSGRQHRPRRLRDRRAPAGRRSGRAGGTAALAHLHGRLAMRGFAGGRCGRRQ